MIESDEPAVCADCTPLTPSDGSDGETLQRFRLFASGENPGYRKDEEVFNSYGRRPNDNLLLEYGFSMADNEHDAVQLGIAVPLSDPLWHPKRKLLARNGVGTGRPLCLKAGELCGPMLVLYRVLHMDEPAVRRALPHFFDDRDRAAPPSPSGPRVSAATCRA